MLEPVPAALVNVGIYIGAENPQSGGSYSFVHGVLEGLRATDCPHSFTILHSAADQSSIAGFPTMRVAQPKLRLGRLMANRFRGQARRDEIRAADVATELDSLGLHLVWFLTPAALPTNVPYVATVWDIAHRLEPSFPEVRSTGWTWDEREDHYRKVLPKASYVVVGASAARDDLARCYGVDPRRVRVLPLVIPARGAPEAPAAAPAQSPYLFYPAQFWPHKNHAGLLLALKLVRERHGLDYQLVLCGSDKGNLAHIRALAAELDLESHVRFEGFVSDARLTALYRGAFALAFPSFFGPDNLPPLEAMQLGCPVIAAGVPGAEEQLGDAALLVDQRSPESIAAAIVRLHRDPAFREALVRRGLERAARWGPSAYARGMQAVMSEFEAERRCWAYTSPYVHT